MEECTIRHPAASGMALVVGQWTGEGPGAESTGTLVTTCSTTALPGDLHVVDGDERAAGHVRQREVVVAPVVRVAVVHPPAVVRPGPLGTVRSGRDVLPQPQRGEVEPVTAVRGAALEVDTRVVPGVVVVPPAARLVTRPPRVDGRLETDPPPSPRRAPESPTPNPAARLRPSPRPTISNRSSLDPTSVCPAPPPPGGTHADRKSDP